MHSERQQDERNVFITLTQNRREKKQALEIPQKLYCSIYGKDEPDRKGAQKLLVELHDMQNQLTSQK